MRVIFILLFPLLALPIGISYGYSIYPEPTRFLLSLAALAGALMLLGHLSALSSRRGMRRSILAGGIAIIACFQLARVVCYYFQGESFNTRFFFHLELDNALLAWRAYLLLLTSCLAWLTTVLSLAWFAPIPKPAPIRPPRLVLLALLVMLVEPDVLGYLRYSHERHNDYWTETTVVSDESLHGLYLDPRALNGRLGNATPGRNLVLIYLESLEASYFDEAIFGDLVPNLRRLRAESLDFGNLVQTEGTGFTIAGIVATQCGTPLLFTAATNGNDTLQNGFLDNVHCLGDILNRAGYRQVFMGGASLDFAGKGRFFDAHHYDAVLGREQLVPRLPDPAYQTGWGLYDDSLLALAREEYRRLADSGEPFNLTLLTLDTHHPVGEPSASCPRYDAIDNSMLHAVHCTDHLIAAFLDDLSTHPAWENTVVALVSDHYAMRNAAQRFYPPFGERRLLFSVLNSGTSGSIARPGGITDIAPTLLDLLDVQHDTGFLAGWSPIREDSPHLTHAIYADTARNSLIRHLNSSVLTNTPAQLCETPPFLAKEPGRILIADREIAISTEGQPLPDDALRTTHSFFALWDHEGYLLSSMVVENGALPGLIYRFRGENFVTLGRADALPLFLQEKIGHDGPEQVTVVGNLLGEMQQVSIEDRGETLVADTLACARVLSSITASVRPDEEPAVIDAFCATGEWDTSRLSADRSRLRLDLVSADGSWFEATLRRNAEGLYRPQSYRPVEPEADVPCYAQLDAGALVVPGARVDGEHLGLTFVRVPGDELLFELDESGAL